MRKPPVYRLWQEVFSLDADVWVPLAENPRVLFKHPPVPSGYTAHREALYLAGDPQRASC